MLSYQCWSTRSSDLPSLRAVVRNSQIASSRTSVSNIFSSIYVSARWCRHRVAGRQKLEPCHPTRRCVRKTCLRHAPRLFPVGLKLDNEYMSRLDLQELLPRFEREFAEIGAVVTFCTSNQLRFVGGTIPWRPFIMLRSGTIDTSLGSPLICQACISISTAFFPLLAAGIFWPLSLFSSFLIPIAALLSFAVIAVLFGAWRYADEWLNNLAECVIAQSAAPVDASASLELQQKLGRP